MTKLWHRRTAGLLVSLLLTASCATMMSPAPQDFLPSRNAAWNQWADQVVDVHFTARRITQLPLTDAFTGLHMVLARADTPIGSLPVTLHASQVTRRQALWLLSKKYGLKMTIEEVRGQPPYLGISKE